MKKLAKLLGVFLVAVFASAAFAQPVEPYPRRPFTQAELDQMLAPIALYPDSLLSQILMAATYPQDVAEAASWSRVNPGAIGDAAVRAVESEPWDPSVISLTAFPQVLAMMDERREWTERLGEAFIEQPEQVMDTVQALRARADAAGNLRSSDELVVQRQGDYYIIEPPTQEVVYVPYYDPRYVYGAWWWPSYQPVYWRPWRGYTYYPRRSLFGWGYGVSVGSGFFFGNFDWGHRYLRYSPHRPWYWRDREYRQGYRWTHDRDRRWRDRDRDGRWRDRDGRRDGDRDRDGRWRDRDGRDRDGRDRRDGDRDRRDRRDRAGTAPQAAPTASPRAATPQPATAPQQGFFPPQSNPVARPTTPRYPTDAVPGATRPQLHGKPVYEQPANASRPVERTYTAPRAQPAPVPVPVPVPVPQQGYGAPVPQQGYGGAPAPQVRQAPPAPAVAAPRAAPARPAAAPAAPARSAPAREPASEQSPESSAPSSPLQRGGGRGINR